MQLSVVIVSYNVRPFLEQCLHSVRAAMSGVEGEVIVVDNASEDDTLRCLPPLFPEVRFIASGKNEGFATACNRGWKAASGGQVLFLNPDTLLPETSLTTGLLYLAQHPHCGALGVRMIDGGGRYLPESKRGFPDPLTSLYKMAGLAALFPRSARFARYYLGHLDEEQNAEAEVLSGAFMMVRRAALEATGGFDENYFMYGEDIDLSWQIRESGWTTAYLAEVCIVHFKGESTLRGSAAYRKHFYGAMDRFVRKYYGGSRGAFLRAAVALRAAAARWAPAPPAREGGGPLLLVAAEEEERALRAAFPQLFLREPAGRIPAEAGLPLAPAIAEAARRTGAGGVLYCTPPLSYAALIDTLRRTGLPALIHARGSTSVVGSGSSRSQGTIYLKNI